MAIEKEKEDARKKLIAEKSRDEALEARDEAKRQTEIAQKALAQVEIEKQIAIAEKIKAQVSERKADSLVFIAKQERNKAEAVLNIIYFFSDNFGLAYDKENNKFGYIDKKLNTKIAFKYDEASPFNAPYTNYAKVGLNHEYYLIDTLGNEYKLGYSFNFKYFQAIDLSNYFENKLLKTEDLRKENILFGMNSAVCNHTERIKILFLKNNNFKKLSPNCQIWSYELEILDLSYNKLTFLPTELSQLKKLKYLNLYQNPISKEEQEKIKKLLPNCEIKF